MKFKPTQIRDENLAGRIASMAAEGKLSHTIVIEGGSEKERAAFSRELAAAFVCSSQAGAKPCGVCSHCKKTLAGRHPDVFEIDGGERGKTLKIDALRDVFDKLMYLPNEADARVYIINNAHFLNLSIQNMLLKNLEEPPRYVKFILECATKHALIPTVLSRAAVFYLGIPDSDKKTDETARAFASGIAAAVASEKEYDIVSAAAPLMEKKRELFVACAGELELIFRDAAVAYFGGTDLISSDPDAARRLARHIGGDKLVSLPGIARDLSDACDLSANINLLVALLCSRLRT